MTTVNRPTGDIWILDGLQPSPTLVKAFRLMVNRSVTWADWDEEPLALD